jgi:cytochrome P450
MAEFKHDRLAFLTRMARTYGDIVQWPFGPFRTWLVTHPDYVHQILTTDAAKFHKSAITKRSLGPTIGNGLILSEGDFWRHQRTLIQPAFHIKRIQEYARVMVDYAVRILDEWRPGQVRDIHHDMMKLTLAIVSKALFDADISDRADNIGATVTQLVEVSNRLAMSILIPPEWVPTRDNRLNSEIRRRLSDITLGFIKQRRASGEDKGDLLSMLLQTKDGDTGRAMSDKQVVDESITLMMAGHETTATALTWTFYLLSQNPRVEAALHAELDRVLTGRLPGFDDLPRLPYTEMVIKESMRLYPPVWAIPRQAIAEVSIGGYTMPKGQIVLLSPWVSHHDGRYFTDPESFAPERWAGDFEKQLPKGAYFPFGGGPRICIGNSFAMMEARLLLAALVQNYSLSLAPGQAVDTEPLVTLRPRYGMKMMLHAREPARELDQRVTVDA